MTISLVSLVILALASWRGTRFFLEDTLFSPVRNQIWAKFPPETTKLGYLFTCPWCLGFWVSAILTVIFVIGGSIGYVIVLILAVSAVVGLLQQLLDR